MEDFKSLYVNALRDQNPKEFQRLRRLGQLEQHLEEKSLAASALYRDLVAGAPRDPGGAVKQPWRREAEEQMLSQMLEFQPESARRGDRLGSPHP